MLVAIIIFCGAVSVNAQLTPPLIQKQQDQTQKQPAESQVIEEKIKVADVEQNLLEIQNQIEKLQGSVSQQDPSASDNGVSKKINMLTELKTLFERQMTALQRLATIKTSTDNLHKEFERFRAQGLAEQPPYTVAQLDSSNDQIESQQQKLTTLDLTRESLQKELEQAQDTLTKAEKKVRDAEEQLKNAQTDTITKLEWELSLYRLEQRIARATVNFKRLQLRANDLEQQLIRQELDLLIRKKEELRRQVAFSRKDLSQKLIELDKKNDDTRLALEKAKITVTTNEVRLDEAREKLEKARGEAEIQRQRDAVNSFDAWLTTSQYRVEALEERLQLISTEKELWRIRYNLFNDGETGQIKEWSAKVTDTIDKLERNQAIMQSRLLTARSSIVDLQKQMSEETPVIDKTIADSTLQALSKREQILTERLTDITALLRMSRLIRAQIDETLKDVSLADIARSVRNVFTAVWNQDLLVLENTSVTVKKVVLSLIVLLIGLYLAKRFTHFVRLQMVKAFHLDESATAAIEKISYYFMVVLLILLALHMVNIPLTLFTFLGGALAIAVGFGAQNLLNNFLSGLIIMMERPIKINDVIEVEGNYGRVRDIGARYTLIRLFSGIDVLVPNSAILEKNVINWTHSDLNVRFSVKVGVAYGTDPRKVEQLLLRASKEDPRILKVPEPIVIFCDFGDNALMFEVFFWLQVTQMMDARIASSDLRYRIDALFKQERITIAFPQRDVHLDTLNKPLQVSLMPHQPPVAGDKPSSQ